MSGSSASSIDIGPMLARANLLRLRGQWGAAADVCVEVLKAQPHNATAHSLLGDIYQDQGRLEEARHWYQLALELNPESEADRARLARVEETLEGRHRRAEWEAVIEGRRQPVATTLLVRESLQRIAALAGAALCGIILVSATILSVREQDPLLTDPDAPLRAPEVRRRPPLVADTPVEVELLRETARLAPGGPGQAVRVALDPRTRIATLRVFLPQREREGISSREFRLRVMREAYRQARALHDAYRSLGRADPPLRAVETYLVAPAPAVGGAGETQLLLIGTFAVENLVVTPDVVTVAELERFLAEGLRAGPGNANPGGGGSGGSGPYWAPELGALGLG